jgi:hypothetical protein
LVPPATVDVRFEFHGDIRHAAKSGVETVSRIAGCSWNDQGGFAWLPLKRLREFSTT